MRLDVELLFDRLEQHAVTDLAHAYFRAGQPEFLRQPDSLAAAMHEDLCGRFCHGIHQ
jgi:hypothetical protein